VKASKGTILIKVIVKIAGRFHYSWIILAGAFLAYACFGVSRHLFPYILPDIEAELNLTHERMGNITSVHFIAYTIMTFVWGIIADRIGPRKCILIGQASILIGLSGMGFMSSPADGFLFYALCGAGAAGQNAPVVRLLSDWFGGVGRGRAMGIALAGFGASTVVLGLVVPIVLASYSWRWVWWISSGFILVSAFTCWFVLVDSPGKKGLAVSRTVLPTESISENLEPLVSRVSIKDILKRGTVWSLAGIEATRGFGYLIFVTFAVAYLEEIGWSVGTAAGVLATWAALQIPAPIIWGIAADRLTKKYLLAIAMALNALGAFIFLGGNTVGGYVGAAIIGFAGIGVPTVMVASLADYYEPTTIGTTWGFMTLLFGIAAVISPTVGGAVADATGTLSTAILVALGAFVLGLILVFLLKKPPISQPES